MNTPLCMLHQKEVGLMYCACVLCSRDKSGEAMASPAAPLPTPLHRTYSALFSCVDLSQRNCNTTEAWVSTIYIVGVRVFVTDKK